MPRPTPSAERPAYPGARYVAQIVAANVAAYRKAADPPMRQADLASRMRALGHPSWSQATASIVETAQRNISPDELLALAIALETTVPDLLDPAGIAGTDERHVALLPAGSTPPGDDDEIAQRLVRPQIPNRLARALLAGRAIVRIRPLDEAGMRWQLEQVSAPTSAREIRRNRERLARFGRNYQITHGPAPADPRPNYDDAAAGEPPYLGFPTDTEADR